VLDEFTGESASELPLGDDSGVTNNSNSSIPAVDANNVIDITAGWGRGRDAIHLVDRFNELPAPIKRIASAHKASEDQVKGIVHIDALYGRLKTTMRGRIWRANSTGARGFIFWLFLLLVADAPYPLSLCDFRPLVCAACASAWAESCPGDATAKLRGKLHEDRERIQPLAQSS